MNNNSTIIFAAGCFWGVEKYLQNLDGVIKTTVGYCGGSYPNPSYESILHYRGDEEIGNHTEAVEVVYDENLISTRDLLQEFWQLHDPTQGNRQGGDVGNNYRSGIYWTTNYQQNLASKTKDIYQFLLEKQITTEIKKLDIFYPAEDYHQNYLQKNPQGYCPNHSTGIKFPVQNKEFYQEFARFKFGENSEEYKVGFHQATDARFCQKYDKFQTTGEGYFVDKFSGAKLFDTKQRFNSGTGWLSFYSPVAGSTIEITDNSHGMTRIEVVAKISGSHLGHAFDGEIANKRRFCINASVLDFVQT